MKIFRNILFAATIGAFLVSCKKTYPEADSLLLMARSLYSSGHFEKAKKMIDSIAKTQPRAFVQINAGMALLDSVRYAENIRIIAQSDSLLKAINTKISQQQAYLLFEINHKYQDKGNYIPKIYPFSAIPSQMELRSGVGEDGTFFLESVSDRPLKHFSAEASTPDGLHAQTASVTGDGANYRFQTGGKSVEVVRYSGKRQNGLAAFIAANRDKNITITLHGKSSASFPLSSNAKRGIIDSYTFSRLISERDSVRFRYEKNKLLVKYLDQRRAREMAARAEKELKK